jgi:hypothetical protein
MPLANKKITKIDRKERMMRLCSMSFNNRFLSTKRYEFAA